VISVLERIAFVRGRPKTMRFDYGAELTSDAMLRWGAERDIDLHFIDPGKPAQNAHVESYNDRARDEFLNLHTFLTLDQAREAAAEWLIDYNEIRRHSSLGNRTPKEFADVIATKHPSQEPAACYLADQKEHSVGDLSTIGPNPHDRPYN
jgi:putative transposase